MLINRFRTLITRVIIIIPYNILLLLVPVVVVLYSGGLFSFDNSTNLSLIKKKKVIRSGLIFKCLSSIPETMAF